ncbi:predicted protein [Histoplasma capsulatum G186AR]|uniref:Uncharacterized protein n=1 Tax=Ajellomyces capsulatus (strain G186AR / H82 / ATCC MYA-2454 / RMSCC 2432) TaxID=447093 RepID=C0NMQ1_AJECG|nr:uncharacterized protein HCBG_04028 [Histoplasma capsulatum G186AR]EEH07149.1 predicted protein [Histoplasma capsulatum G186AR]
MADLHMCVYSATRGEGSVGGSCQDVLCKHQSFCGIATPSSPSPSQFLDPRTPYPVTDNEACARLALLGAPPMPQVLRPAIGPFHCSASVGGSHAGLGDKYI